MQSYFAQSNPNCKTDISLKNVVLENILPDTLVYGKLRNGTEIVDPGERP